MAQEKLAAKIFDSVVKRYDRFLNSVTFGFIKKWQTELVENTPSGKYPLDVGTGTGEVLKKINLLYPDSLPIGLDVSLEMLKKAREKDTEGKNLFIKGSAYNLPFKSSSIGSIYMSLVFRHLDAEKAVKEFKRVLENSGHIGILDISKPSRFLFSTIFFVANRLFRPVGEKIFSKEEYDYFMESVINSRSPEELEKLFNSHGFAKKYIKKRMFGLVVIGVFKKE